MTGRDEHLDGCPSGDFGPCDCDTVVSSGEAQIKRAAKEAGLINRVYRSEGDLWTDSPINLSKFVRFLALQPYVVGSAQDAGAQAARDHIAGLIADLQGEHEAMAGPFDPAAWKLEVPVVHLQALLGAHSPAEVEKPPGFDPEKNYTNHLSVMIDAIGHEAMGKVKAALNIAGYTICKGDPSETGWELKRVKAENEQLRAQVEQEIQNWKVRNKAACRAERALIGAGWTLEAGAEEWKPPLGPSASPLLDRITQLEAQVENAAARDVLAERQRQKDKEGWTIEHDDSHISAEMAMAAAVYALTSFLDTEHSLSMAFTRYWPWDRSWFKPAGGRRDLVRAGALILAEIERLDRREHTSTVSAPK